MNICLFYVQLTNRGRGEKMEYDRRDLRVMKTKEAIESALFKLIDEQSEDDITVKKLAFTAKINRGTFYLHYKNIDELFNTYYDNFESALQPLLVNFKESLLKQPKSDELILQATTQVLNVIEENKQIFKFLLLNPKKIHYFHKLQQFTEEIMFTNYDNLPTSNTTVPQPYYGAYAFSSFMKIAEQWVERDCQESSEEIAKILSTLNIKGPFIEFNNSKR